MDFSAWRNSLEPRQRAGGCALSVCLGFVCAGVWFGHVFGDYIGPRPMPAELRLEQDVAIALGQASMVLCAIVGLWLTARSGTDQPEGCASIGASTIRGVIATLLVVYLPLLCLMGVVGAFRAWTDESLPNVLSRAVSFSANVFLGMASGFGLFYLVGPALSRLRRRPQG